MVTQRLVASLIAPCAVNGAPVRNGAMRCQSSRYRRSGQELGWRESRARARSDKKLYAVGP